MKRWKKVMLSILAILILIIVTLAIWQHDNIHALFLYFKHSPKNIEEIVANQREESKEVLKKYDGITVTDLTPEQEAAIMNGQMTVEEAIVAMGAEDSEDNTSKGQNTHTDKETSSNSGSTHAAEKPGITSGNSTTPSDNKDNNNQNNGESALINRYMKKIYSVKAKFLGELAGVKNSAFHEFNALPPEKRTESAKKSILASKIMQCYELENTCDVEINTILQSLKSELKKIGADIQIVSDIRTAYQNEKSAKKAYYLSLIS